MDISQAVHEILLKMLKSSHNLLQIMLTDPTGLVISQVSRNNSFNIEGIGGLASALYFGMREQGEGLMDLGSLGFMISEFLNGKLIIRGVGKDFVLISVTKSRINTSSVRKIIQRYENDLFSIIELLKTSREIEKQTNKVKHLELNKVLSELDF